MLLMKQKGHSFYNIVERKQYIHNIKQMKSIENILTLDDIIKQRNFRDFGNYLLQQHNMSTDGVDAYSPQFLLVGIKRVNYCFLPLIL